MILIGLFSVGLFKDFVSILKVVKNFHVKIQVGCVSKYIPDERNPV